MFQVLSAEESGGNPVHHPSLVHRSHSAPMLLQGLRTNLKDPDSHVVYFDTEALIGAFMQKFLSLGITCPRPSVALQCSIVT